MKNLSFAVAVAALLEAGAHIRRVGWRQKFHLELEAFGVYTSAVIVRVSESRNERNPWAVVTEDDALANDWEIMESTAFADIPEDFTPSIGTYAHAFASLVAGAKAIRMSVGWHPDMQVKLVDGEVKIKDVIVKMGKVMVLRIPSGEWKYYRPAPQDLAGAWSVVQ